MKLLRLAIATAALVATVVACDATRLTAPEDKRPPAAPAPPPAPTADVFMGSGG